jgi:hypothetical protein
MRKIFIHKLANNLDMFGKRFMIKRDDVILLIKDTGFTGENVTEIVDSCFSELFTTERQRSFDGILYYDFMQILMWLSLVFIQNEKEGGEDGAERKPESPSEVNEETLVEKLKFFVEILGERYADNMAKIDIE